MTCSVYSGAGNTFVILDDRNNEFPSSNQKLIAQLSSQVDGFILVRSSTIADFQMKFYNNNGVEEALCGNGLRCFARFVQEKLGFSEKNVTIETFNRLLTASYHEKKVTTNIGSISDIRLNIEISFQGNIWKVHHAHTGVPHLVIFVENIDDLNVQEIGAFFRYHPLFQPNGANVNFVQRNCVRTYERGVERETLACGTGAVAVGIIQHILFQTPSPISLQTHSKEILEIHFEKNFENVTLTGNAEWIQDLNICPYAVQ